MPLMECPVCGRQISTEAEACPQCGHPNRNAPTKTTTESRNEPSCYSCSSLATTRCQSCGAMSCARHLQSIYVSHGRGGGYELRCSNCYSSAVAWKAFSIVLFIIGLIIFLAFATNR